MCWLSWRERRKPKTNPSKGSVPWPRPDSLSHSQGQRPEVTFSWVQLPDPLKHVKKRKFEICASLPWEIAWVSYMQNLVFLATLSKPVCYKNINSLCDVLNCRSVDLPQLPMILLAPQWTEWTAPVFWQALGSRGFHWDSNQNTCLWREPVQEKVPNGWDESRGWWYFGSVVKIY